MALKTFTLTLEWAEMLSPTVRHLAFRRDDGLSPEFIPGQFISVHIETPEKTVRRSYSLATVPSKSDLYEFAVGYVENGLATKLLFSIEPGETITASGPAGRLILGPQETQPQRYFLLATNTGVTPYRTMLPELTKRFAETNIEVSLLFGVRKPADLLYGDEFIAFAKQHENFSFHACYSRAQSKQPQPFEHSGYIQHLLKTLNPNPETDHVYLCGNPGMIDESFAMLRELEFPTASVKREKYISSK